MLIFCYCTVYSALLTYSDSVIFGDSDSIPMGPNVKNINDEN